MEDVVKEENQSETPLPGNGGPARPKLQRYALRSGAKSKEEKPPVAELPNHSATKRGVSTSSLSKSVSVLDLSGKDKSAKPPRRLSIPTKSTISPAPKLSANITPISEVRTRRTAGSQGKSDTPASEVSRSTSRKKFSVLASASYWLSQIKLSESAAKHSISLGFFKLAFEAGCEPLQRMRDELKAYAQRNNLSEQEELVKELFDKYNIIPEQLVEQLQESETCSQMPEEGTRSSDDDVLSSSSTGEPRKLRPRSLNTDAPQSVPVTESAKKGTTQKSNHLTRSRGSLNKASVISKPVSETRGQKSLKKPEKPKKLESDKEKDKIKRGKKSTAETVRESTSPAEDMPQENKENVDALSTEAVASTEVM